MPAVCAAHSTSWVAAVIGSSVETTSLGVSVSARSPLASAVTRRRSASMLTVSAEAGSWASVSSMSAGAVGWCSATRRKAA